MLESVLKQIFGKHFGGLRSFSVMMRGGGHLHGLVPYFYVSEPLQPIYE